MTGWRAALRIARRSVRRHLGRSLLIIALLALPVAGLTVVDGLVRTATDRDVEVDRAMGTADARITVTDRSVPHFAVALPEDARVVPLGATYYTGSLRLAVGDRMVRTRLAPVELGDPLTAHLARLVSGRLPADAGEALVTRPLAERLDVLDEDGNLRPGATLRTTGGHTVDVTGIAVQPYCLSCADVVAHHNSVLKAALLDGNPTPLGYLVDLPEGTDPDAIVIGRNATVTTRESYVDPTPLGGYLLAAAGDPVALFAGLGLLGIVVTAGAAFAVGARRQVRELGLVTVNGGTAKHVRRIVLAQGLVLGVLGAATGLVLGGAVTVLGVPLWEPVTDQLIEDLRFGWAELAVAALVGVLASVVAATVPAINVGRMSPVDALSGRFRTGASTARLPLVGLFLVLAGVAAVVVAAVLARARVTEHQKLLERYDAAPPLQTLPVLVTLAGAVLTVLGLVLVMPALTAAVSRLGGWLPLSGRLAVRDALRHRQRTVAAGTAVMVTVAGSVVAAFVFATRADTEPRTLPRNTALARLDAVGVGTAAPSGPGQLEQVARTVTETVPGAVAREVLFVTAHDDGVASSAISLDNAGPGCWDAFAQLGVGTPEMVELATGRKPDDRVLSALAEGEVVVFDTCLVNRAHMVPLSTIGPATVPAYAATPAPGTGGYDRYLPRAFISPEAAAARGWHPFAESVVVTYPMPGDLHTVRAAAEAAGLDLHVGEAADTEVTGLFFVLAGLAALVALVGAGVTVALSGTDGRADLATLAALGAPPRRRRTLAGAHAMVVTVVGTLTGVALGVCTALAAVPVAGLPGVSVPWQHLLLTTLAVPLLASVVAALATPSRLPMVGRQER